MPTYTVTSSNFSISSKQQKKLAEGITKVHNVVTGANTYFAQVIFNNTKKKNHFMGGKIVKEPSIFLLGQIRAGRPKKTKDKLISDLKKPSYIDMPSFIKKNHKAKKKIGIYQFDGLWVDIANIADLQSTNKMLIKNV